MLTGINSSRKRADICLYFIIFFFNIMFWTHSVRENGCLHASEGFSFSSEFRFPLRRRFNSWNHVLCWNCLNFSSAWTTSTIIICDIVTSVLFKKTTTKKQINKTKILMDLCRSNSFFFPPLKVWTVALFSVHATGARCWVQSFANVWCVRVIRAQTACASWHVWHGNICGQYLLISAHWIAISGSSIQIPAVWRSETLQQWS